MRTQVKLGLYVVTVLGTLLFGSLFLRTWRAADPAPSTAAARPAPRRSTAPSPSATNAPTAGATNAATAAGTDAASTNAPTASAPAATNAPAAADAETVAAPEPTPETEAVPTRTTLGPRSKGLGRIVVWALLAVVSLIGLGCLVAYDVSHYAAHRATRLLLDDDPSHLAESAYEEIEKLHAGGDFLEAIRMLREFLKKNPKAAHAQIRIAEIYEKDLNNPLAAALEYEEVLKLRLDPERKGWTSIHLVNLYNRMDKPDRAVALLQQIVLECPGTPAAGKARERLESLGVELPETPPEDDPGTSPGMPRGFKRK